MSDKQIKTAADVIPRGDLISSLLMEAARRITRNGEKIQYLMEEFIPRFKLDPQQVYGLLSELQRMGFDPTPNEWLFFTPVENRTAMLSTIVKNAKMYGSRHEDMMEALKDVAISIREVKKWLADNANLQKLSPQSYMAKREELMRLERCKKDLEVSKKLTASTLVYDPNYKSGQAALTIMNFAVGDKVYAILKAGNDDIVQSPVSDLQEETPVAGAMKDDDIKTQTISLKKSFDNLKEDAALKPFYDKFSEMQQSDFDSPQVVEKNIDALLNTIDDMAQLKTVTDQEKNDAYKAVKNFVEAREQEGIKLNTKVNEYVDDSIQPSEGFTIDEAAGTGGDVVDKEQGGDFSPENTPGNIPPATENVATKMMSSGLGVKTAAATESEMEIATALKFVEKISRMLGEVQKSASIPKTAHVDSAIGVLQSSLSDIKNYISSEWPHNSPAEKKAAIIILSNINKKLSSLVDLYTGSDGEQELMKYVVSSDFIRILRTAKIMLTTIGD